MVKGTKDTHSVDLATTGYRNDRRGGCKITLVFCVCFMMNLNLYFRYSLNHCLTRVVMMYSLTGYPNWRHIVVQKSLAYSVKCARAPYALWAIPLDYSCHGKLLLWLPSCILEVLSTQSGVLTIVPGLFRDTKSSITTLTLVYTVSLLMFRERSK